MKKYIITILLIICSIGLLIYAGVVAQTQVENTFFFNSRSVFDNDCGQELVLYDGISVDEVDTLLKDKMDDSYVGITYAVNIYEGQVTSGRKTSSTNIFLATESVVNSYKFWTLSQGYDISFAKTAGAIPIIVYGTEFANTAVGTTLEVELLNASGENYIASTVVVGVASDVTQIPEADNYSAIDMASIKESFIIMPEIDDLSYLRYNRYVILQEMSDTNLLALFNLSNQSSIIYPIELSEYGYVIDTAYIVLLANYFDSDGLGAYIYVVCALLLILVFIVVLIVQIVGNAQEKELAKYTQGGAKYGRI